MLDRDMILLPMTLFSLLSNEGGANPGVLPGAFHRDPR